MRKLLGLAAGMSLAFLSTGAFADGYSSGPVQGYQPFSWTGLYIGGQIGESWGNEDFKFAPTTTVHDHFSGFAYGGQIGAQYQFSHVVVGVEVSYTNDHDGRGSTLCPNPTFQCRARIDDATQVVGRLGYAWGNFLPYFKAGYASVYSHFNNTPPTFAINSATHRHDGWVLGGGLEYGIYKNIILGVDYSHIEFDRQTFFAGNATFGGDGSADIVMARLSYKFSWDREVVPLK